MSDSSQATFVGELGDARLGTQIASLGDVDGDGIDDLIVSAQHSADCGWDNGQVYVVTGGPGPWSVDASIDEAEYSFCGEHPGDTLTIVAGAGDVDGDGVGDILMGAVSNNESAYKAGQAYLVLGRADGWPAAMPVSGADASFLGEGEWDAAGHLLSTAGDVDGDGLDDFLIVAPYNNDGGPQAGKVYLYFGRTTGWSMDTTLALSDASFLGELELGLTTVSGGGDVDGDGLDDIAIGIQNYLEPGENRSGQIYLFFGRPWGWGQGGLLSESDASLVGESQVKQAGVDDSAGYVATAGDYDGDGIDDLVVGAPGSDQAELDAGKGYLVLGREGGWSAEMPLENADGTLVGENTLDLLGMGQHGGRGDPGTHGSDVDGDGFDDLLFCARNNDQGGEAAGKCYLVRGFPDARADLSSAIAATFIGDAPGDHVDGILAGDLNDDGYDDLAFTAIHNDEAGEDAGQIYLVFGAPCVDADGDGFTDCEECDDGDAAVHPGAVEVCNGIDDDCDPATDEDADGDADGFSICDGDCVDTDGGIHPGAEEDCDGLDTDCDGLLGADEADADGDGYSICDGDCEDSIPTAHPDAEEVCDNGIDDDCDGVVDDHDLDCQDVDPGDDDTAPGDDDTGGCECHLAPKEAGTITPVLLMALVASIARRTLRRRPEPG